MILILFGLLGGVGAETLVFVENGSSGANASKGVAGNAGDKTSLGPRMREISHVVLAVVLQISMAEAVGLFGRVLFMKGGRDNFAICRRAPAELVLLGTLNALDGLEIALSITTRVEVLVHLGGLSAALGVHLDSFISDVLAVERSAFGSLGALDPFSFLGDAPTKLLVALLGRIAVVLVAHGKEGLRVGDPVHERFGATLGAKVFGWHDWCATSLLNEFLFDKLAKIVKSLDVEDVFQFALSDLTNTGAALPGNEVVVWQSVSVSVPLQNAILITLVEGETFAEGRHFALPFTSFNVFNLDSLDVVRSAREHPVVFRCTASLPEFNAGADTDSETFQHGDFGPSHALIEHSASVARNAVSKHDFDLFDIFSHLLDEHFAGFGHGITSWGSGTKKWCF